MDPLEAYMVNEEAHDIGEVGDGQDTVPNRNVDEEDTVFKFLLVMSLMLRTTLVAFIDNTLTQYVKVVLAKKRLWIYTASS